MKIKTQSIIEYILLIGLVGTVLIGMNTYAKRGIQAVIKLSADKLASQEGYRKDRESPGLGGSRGDSKEESLVWEKISKGKLEKKKGSFSSSNSKWRAIIGEQRDRRL